MATVAGSSVVQDAGFRFTGSVSVFFPAFNDAPSLPELLRKTFETLERCVSDYEVIVVNDGSSDDTAAVLERLRLHYAPHLRVVTHEQNQGYGAALRSGFHAASKDFIFYTDGDGQYDPSELETLLRAAGSDAGLVNGYKIERHDPWHRIAIGWLYNRFARWLFGIRLRDIDCDFRLIRRSVFEPSKLQSTGGTICVELVRQLELSGARVVEVPVHHYPRLHGRSQFFRVKSLASTFLQLLAVFLRLVVAPAFTPAAEPRPGPAWFAIAALSIVAASFAAYARALSLPFIADDYIQVQLGRDFGPAAKWDDLAADVLYRWRATSVVFTHWLEQAFGLSSLLFTAAGVALHAVNSLLVLALGAWRLVGWRAAAAAALFFAYSQRHSEAVIWHAALPELLVFFFTMACFLGWIQWLQRPANWAWYALSCAAFGLALLSKESAVAAIPLMILAALAERRFSRIWGVAPFVVAGAAYFASIYAAGDAHLHLTDGTFSLSAPFLWVMLRSGVGLLWVWGAVTLGLAALRVIRPRLSLILIGLAWIFLALLPYSFLTYMTRVPSRHTYLASAGLALIVGAGFTALWRTRMASARPWLAPAAAILSFALEAGYIWTVQHDRYVARAEPTELLLRSVPRQGDAVYSACFPYSQFVADYALRIGHPGRPGLHLEQGPAAARHPGARDFCNSTAEGIRY